MKMRSQRFQRRNANTENDDMKKTNEKKDKKDKPIATLTIHGLPGMTTNEKISVSTWLICQAGQVWPEGSAFAKRYTARLMPRKERSK